MMIRLRPHHLLCIQGFHGEGYSPEFASRLATLAAAVTAVPGLPVAIADGPDDICDAFPHRTGRECGLDASGGIGVRELDAGVLEALGFPAGAVTSIAAVAGILAGNPMAKASVDALCAGCRWRSVCGRFPGGD